MCINGLNNKTKYQKYSMWYSMPLSNSILLNKALHFSVNDFAIIWNYVTDTRHHAPNTIHQQMDMRETESSPAILIPSIGFFTETIIECLVSHDWAPKMQNHICTPRVDLHVIYLIFAVLILNQETYFPLWTDRSN